MKKKKDIITIIVCLIILAICVGVFIYRGQKKKEAYKNDEEIMAAIADCEKKMEGNGRVLIRPSGTEPLVRVMLEGDDTEELQKLAESIASLIEDRLA